MGDEESIFDDLKAIELDEDQVVNQTPEQLAEKLSNNGYNVISIIGSGWISEVVRATGPHGEVAVKVLNKAAALDKKVKERFVINAQHNAQLSSSTSFPIVDISEIEGQPYYVMSEIAKSNLFSIIDKHAPLDIDWTLGILKGIAYQIDYAHSLSVFHGNIKPSNILIAVDGMGEEKGILVDYVHPSTIFSRSGLEGSGIYTAPEVYSSINYDNRSDVFSFACVLYHALTGSAPFGPTIDGDGECVPWHADEPPKHFSLLRPDITVVASDLIMSALSKDPKKRPQSASALIDGVADAIKRSRTQPANLLIKQPAKVPVALVVGGVALMALVALFIVIKFLGGGGEQTPSTTTVTTQVTQTTVDSNSVLSTKIPPELFLNCQDALSTLDIKGIKEAQKCNGGEVESLTVMLFKDSDSVENYLSKKEKEYGNVEKSNVVCAAGKSVQNNWGTGIKGSFLCNGNTFELVWSYTADNVVIAANSSSVDILTNWWNAHASEFPKA